MPRHDLDIPVPPIKPIRGVTSVRAVSLHRMSAPARAWLGAVRAFYRDKIRQRLRRKSDDKA